ncbi:hypothetical protein RGUI_3170 [Rhodovulum sp. P5]|nr:hypothetical protein RGUI_3170 [Rhodovulum sp. P5]
MGVTPPVVTREGRGEDLNRLFDPQSFHLVVAINALDRTSDPMQCIERMIEVCKPGGSVILSGPENWALQNAYGGLNQWNFLAVDDDLTIWRPNRKISLQKALGARAIVRARTDDPDRYFVEIHVPEVSAEDAEVAPVGGDAVDYAELYDDVYDRIPSYTMAHMSPGLRTALRHADELLCAGRDCLDVGGGPGYLVEALRLPPFRKRAFGADISRRAVELAEKRLGPDIVRVIDADGRLPFDDASFDLITCFDVLEHLDEPDIDRLVGEIRRVGRKGGTAIFNISLRDSASKDITGASLHRTVRPVPWWIDRLPFAFYSVEARESELYGRLNL